MSERITAEAARRLSNTILGEKVKDQLDQCEKAINKSVAENKMNASVPFKLDQLAKKDLESRGFTTSYTEGDFRDPREHGYTTIKW